MKALIIGGAGFVGSYLIDAVKEDLKCEVCVTKSLHHHLDRSDVRYINLNILDNDAVENVICLEQPDYIFHLAAQSSIYQSWKNPSNTVEINVIGSLHVLNAIKKLKKAPVVIMVGSGEEYGIATLNSCPIGENNLLLPQNIYAATKVCQNMMSYVYHIAYGMHVVMVRAFNHVGPGQSDKFVISDFCHQVARIENSLQEPIIRVGNIQAKRDFTDVRDVVRAYTRLAQFGIWGETYNVGSGHAVKICDILDKILQKAKVDIRVFQDERKVRPLDVPVIEADISKIYSTIGWQPQITLDVMLDDMLSYWRKWYV